MSLDFNLSEENRMVQQAIKDAIAPWATTRRPELRKMILNFIAEQELGLPKSY